MKLGERSSSATSLALLTLASACNLIGYETGRSSETAPFPDAASADATFDSRVLADGTVAGDGNVEDAGVADGSRSLTDGAADGAGPGQLLDAGWWDGRDNDFTCGEGRDCSPRCAGPGASCVFDGVEANTVQATCEAQTACYLDCTESNNCDLACAQGAQCVSQCASGNNCSLSCATGATCMLDCVDANNCGLDCAAGASCEVDCSGEVDCDEFHCPADSQCLLHCPDDGCSLDCEGNGQSCPNNHEVCNRDCPEGL